MTIVADHAHDAVESYHGNVLHLVGDILAYTGSPPASGELPATVTVEFVGELGHAHVTLRHGNGDSDVLYLDHAEAIAHTFAAATRAALERSRS